MTVQTVTAPLRIEWDDSDVIVFSFDGPNGPVFCGFVLPRNFQETRPQARRLPVRGRPPRRDR